MSDLMRRGGGGTAPIARIDELEHANELLVNQAWMLSAFPALHIALLRPGLREERGQKQQKARILNEWDPRRNALDTSGMTGGAKKAGEEGAKFAPLMRRQCRVGLSLPSLPIVSAHCMPDSCLLLDAVAICARLHGQ